MHWSLSGSMLSFFQLSNIGQHELVEKITREEARKN